jgi:hypothetical protein
MERDFKGVWIPKEIWLNEELTMLDKVILVEIDSLDNNEGCVASNEYLCNFCQCSQQKLSTSITKLKELGFVEFVSFDGRKRVMKSNMKNMVGRLPKNGRQTSKKAYATYQKVVPNNIDNNIVDYLKEDKDKSLSKKVAKNLDLSAVQPHMMNVVETWLAYKKEKKKQYTQKGLDAFYKKIVKLSGNNANKAMQIVEESMSNNWDGIFPLRENFTRKDNFEIGMVLSDDREAIYKDMEENGWMHD